jgi:hypothetical protein
MEASIIPIHPHPIVIGNIDVSLYLSFLAFVFVGTSADQEIRLRL